MQEINVGKLKSKLVEKGISITELGAILGKNRSTVYKKLKGETPITIREARLIAQSLGLSEDEIATIFFAV